MRDPAGNDREPLLTAAFYAALNEERGLLIALLYGLPEADVERLVDAAQLIDAEGQEVLDG